MKPYIIPTTFLFVLFSCSDDDSAPPFLEDFSVLSGTWAGWSATDFNPAKTNGSNLEDSTFVELDLEFTEDGQFTMSNGRIIESGDTLDLNQEINGQIGPGIDVSLFRSYSFDCNSELINRKVEFFGILFEEEGTFNIRALQTFQQCPEDPFSFSVMEVAITK